MATLSHDDAQAAPPRIGVVASRFHEEVCEGLLVGCLTRLEEAGADPASVEVIRVPGAFDIPFACRALADRGDCDALVALGCVVRGETAHFEYVAGECARGVMEAGMETGVPIAFGVLTTDTLEQARLRSDRTALVGSDAGQADKTALASNKGWEAAGAALELAEIVRMNGTASAPRREA